MRTNDGVEIVVGMQVFIYPGDDVIGGTIKPQKVGGMEGNKILYEQPDERGMIGARCTAVYANYKEAEAKRTFDREHG